MILLDPPLVERWGRRWSHLASDSSFAELHDFAVALGIPGRGFDRDHYDIPAELYDAAVAAGAVPVSSRELVAALRRAGLRRRKAGAAARTGVPGLAQRWPLSGADDLREELLAAWGADGRGYHDLRHLAEVLDRLDELGCDDPAVRLAAWFHDAVYDLRPGAEERSAAWAEEALPGAGVAPDVVAEVARLVLVTERHLAAEDDGPALALCDADLAILAADRGRYAEYVAGVRREYAHLSAAEFTAGRAAVLRDLLDRRMLFGTPYARGRWESPARANLQRELDALAR